MKNSIWLLLFVLLLVNIAVTGADRRSKSKKSLGYIDTHIHIVPVKPPFTQRSKSGGSQRKSRPDPQKMKKSFMQAFQQTIKELDRYGIEKALVVIVPGKSAENAEREYMPRKFLTSRFSKRLGLMAGGAQLQAYLNKPPKTITKNDRRNFKKLAEKLLDEGAVGFGEMISYHLCLSPGHSFQEVPADHPLFLYLADIAAKHNVPIDIHIEAVEKKEPMPERLKRASQGKNPKYLEPTIPSLEKLLEHNRQARIVWQHIGWDNTGYMTIKLLRRMLKTHPNLYMALRVEVRDFQAGDRKSPMPNRIVDSKGEIKKEWLKFFNEFPNRFVIGSDNFFFSDWEKANPVAKSFDETWSMAKKLPSKLRKKICHDNPIRIYSLGKRSK